MEAEQPTTCLSFKPNVILITWKQAWVTPYFFVLFSIQNLKYLSTATSTYPRFDFASLTYVQLKLLSVKSRYNEVNLWVSFSLGKVMRFWIAKNEYFQPLRLI